MRFSWSLAVLAAIVASPVVGQEGYPAGTPSAKRMSDYYNPATLVAMRGKVTTLETIELKPGLTGVVANLELSNGVVTPVILGSVDFMRNNYIGLQEGVTMEVTGSRVVFDAKPAVVIADTAVIGNNRLVIRDYDGTPAWIASPDVARAPVYGGGESSLFLERYQAYITGLTFLDQGDRLTGAAIRINGEALAYVGNLEYLRERGITFKINDRVFITGPRASVNGMSLVVVHAIEQNGKIVKLYDGQKPLWREDERPEYREFSEPIPLAEIDGEVESDISYNYGNEEGILLDVKAGNGVKHQAFLPSRDYLKERKWEVTKGQKIKLYGSEAVSDGKPILIPHSVELDNTRITLRDMNGELLKMQE